MYYTRLLRNYFKILGIYFQNFIWHIRDVILLSYAPILLKEAYWFPLH